MEKKYKEVSIYMESFDDMINRLLTAKENNELISCDFNGHKFYSDTITWDSAYLEVKEMTKKDYDHYNKNLYEILRSTILDGQLVTKKELFEDFVNEVLIFGNDPVIAQAQSISIRLLDNLCFKRISEFQFEAYKLEKLHPFAKEYTYKFINKYAKEDLKVKTFAFTNIQSYERKEETKKLERKGR